MKVSGCIVELVLFGLLAGLVYLPYHFFGGAVLLGTFGLLLLIATVKESYGWAGGMIAGGVVTTIYAFAGMPIFYVFSLLIGFFLITVALGSIGKLFNLEPGSGSVLTALVLGIPVMFLLGGGLFWFGLEGLDYLKPVFQWLDI